MSAPLDESQTGEADLSHLTSTIHESTTILHSTPMDWSGWTPGPGDGSESRHRRTGSWSDMAHLNNRLGTYMEKVRALEKKNSALSIEITRRELRYENDLARLRKQLEDLEKEKKRLADDHASEVERLNREYDRVVSELTVIKTQSQTQRSAGVATEKGGKDEADYQPNAFDEITLEAIEVEYTNKLQENADRMRQYYEEQIIKTRAATVTEFQSKVDRERADNRALLDRKDAENHDLRDELKKQKDAHDELEYELRRYRVLLETGENRLKIADLDNSGIPYKRIKLGFKTGVSVVNSAQKNLDKSYTSIRLIPSMAVETTGQDGQETMGEQAPEGGWADLSEAGSDISDKDRLADLDGKKPAGAEDSSSWVRPQARLHRQRKKAGKKEGDETPKKGEDEDDETVPEHVWGGRIRRGWARLSESGSDISDVSERDGISTPKYSDTSWERVGSRLNRKRKYSHLTTGVDMHTSYTNELTRPPIHKHAPSEAARSEKLSQTRIETSDAGFSPSTARDIRDTHLQTTSVTGSQENVPSAKKGTPTGVSAMRKSTTHVEPERLHKETRPIRYPYVTRERSSTPMQPRIMQEVSETLKRPSASTRVVSRDQTQLHLSRDSSVKKTVSGTQSQSYSARALGGRRSSQTPVKTQASWNTARTQPHTSTSRDLYGRPMDLSAPISMSTTQASQYIDRNTTGVQSNVRSQSSGTRSGLNSPQQRTCTQRTLSVAGDSSVQTQPYGAGKQVGTGSSSHTNEMTQTRTNVHTSEGSSTRAQSFLARDLSGPQPLQRASENVPEMHTHTDSSKHFSESKTVNTFQSQITNTAETRISNTNQTLIMGADRVRLMRTNQTQTNDEYSRCTIL